MVYVSLLLPLLTGLSKLFPGFSPKLSSNGSIFTILQVTYSFLFTFTLLYYFYPPSVLQAVLLADLASLSDSCSSDPFHLHGVWPSFNLWSLSPNEAEETGRVFLFSTSII